MKSNNNNCGVIEILQSRKSPFGDYLCDCLQSDLGLALVHDGKIELASISDPKRQIHIYIYGGSISVTRRVNRRRYVEWVNDPDLAMPTDEFSVYFMSDAELSLILAYGKGAYGMLWDKVARRVGEITGVSV